MCRPRAQIFRIAYFLSSGWVVFIELVLFEEIKIRNELKYHKMNSSKVEKCTVRDE